MLPYPFQGIPGNPIHQNIQGVSNNSNQSSFSLFDESYVSRGGIYD